ncbi:MAG: carbohydrate porin [Stenotrophomonas sp.]|uniref:carbohydrate porin n=1 Tax=Stenotrophomonas sp. TaxID=69392 RepID=UPI0028B22513|nr:carbohydrate porin [Stenotrophomonas sp.]
MRTYCRNGRGSIFSTLLSFVFLGAATSAANAQPTEGAAGAPLPDGLSVADLQDPPSGEPASTQAAVPGCRDYDAFVSRGSESPIITTCETLSPDLLGLRPKLYDNGWMFMGFYSAAETYDLRGQEARPQVYNGQRPSFSGTLVTITTYDLSRLGWWGRKSQLTFEANSWRTTYRDAGMNDDAAVSQLSVEQEFKDGRVRLQYGYYGMLGQFIGLFLGASTASSALGPTSIIPNLAGMAAFKPVPGVDVRLYSKNGRFYDHFGVARSQHPDGFLADSKANPTGLKWSVEDTKPIYVNEIGYRVASSADSRMTWIRQGTLYNRTLYQDFSKAGAKGSNRAFYLIADHQFTQPDISMPYRGWYFNLKTNYAAPEHNIFTADYAATLYSLAPFAKRPGDMISIGYTYNKISKDAQNYLGSMGMEPVRFSSTASVSYALRALRGIYWVNTLSYTRNPVITQQHPDAMTLQSQLTFSF